MALDKESMDELEAALQKHLKAAWSQGLETGVCTVSETVLTYLNDSTISLPERIQKIKKFCETPLRKKKEKQETES